MLCSSRAVASSACRSAAHAAWEIAFKSKTESLGKRHLELAQSYHLRPHSLICVTAIHTSRCRWKALARARGQGVTSVSSADRLRHERIAREIQARALQQQQQQQQRQRVSDLLQQ